MSGRRHSGWRVVWEFCPLDGQPSAHVELWHSAQWQWYDATPEEVRALGIVELVPRQHGVTVRFTEEVP